MSTLAQLQTLINAIGTGEKNTAEEMRAILNAFSTSVYLTGDIKEVDCTTAYVLANFDNTGLGINERVGWAVCNGLNGTKNRVGRTSIGYGDTYSTVGATGGSKDAILVEHEHLLFSPSETTTSSNLDGLGYPVVDSDGTGWGSESYRIRKSLTVPTLGRSSKTGVSATDKNMQPYIVTLMIQKL